MGKDIQKYNSKVENIKYIKLKLNLFQIKSINESHIKSKNLNSFLLIFLLRLFSMKNFLI